MRARKAEIFAELRRGYAVLRAQWGGYAGYDAFIAAAGNAHLASFALYNAWLPALQRLLELGNGDLASFYAAVRRLANLPRTEREAALAGVLTN
jgi:predicted aminopeptidase